MNTPTRVAINSAFIVISSIKSSYYIACPNNFRPSLFVYVCVCACVYVLSIILTLFFFFKDSISPIPFSTILDFPSPSLIPLIYFFTRFGHFPIDIIFNNHFSFTLSLSLYFIISLVRKMFNGRKAKKKKIMKNPHCLHNIALKIKH